MRLFGAKSKDTTPRARDLNSFDKNGGARLSDGQDNKKDHAPLEPSTVGAMLSQPHCVIQTKYLPSKKKSETIATKVLHEGNSNYLPIHKPTPGKNETSKKDAAPATPPSILHKKKHYTGLSQSPCPKMDPRPQASTDDNLQFSSPHSASTRVRFMSSSSSVLSADASEVHLMAGASVASSSNFSSSRDGGENIFDRVLNMVMAEEEVERLNAMGMSSGGLESEAPFTRSTDLVSRDRGNDLPPTFVPVNVANLTGARASLPVSIELGTELEVNSTDDTYHDLNDDDINEATFNPSRYKVGQHSFYCDERSDITTSFPPGQRKRQHLISEVCEGNIDYKEAKHVENSDPIKPMPPSGRDNRRPVRPHRKPRGKNDSSVWESSPQGFGIFFSDFENEEWVAFDNSNQRSGAGNLTAF